jgi:hypothetical protein
MRFRLFLLASCLLLDATLTWAQPSVGPALLRVDRHWSPQGADLQSEWLVFRNGTTVYHFRTDNSSSYCITEGKAHTEAIQTLGQRLVDLQVGKQAGGCQYSFGPQLGSFEETITWFGKGSRSHTFRVGLDQTQFPFASCPDNSARVAAAFDAYLGAFDTNLPDYQCYNVPIDAEALCK